MARARPPDHLEVSNQLRRHRVLFESNLCSSSAHASEALRLLMNHDAVLDSYGPEDERLGAKPSPSPILSHGSRVNVVPAENGNDEDGVALAGQRGSQDSSRSEVLISVMATPNKRPKWALRPPVPSSPVLLHHLPLSADLAKESELASELELERQSKEMERAAMLEEALKDAEVAEVKKEVKDRQGSWVGLLVGKGKTGGKKPHDGWDETRKTKGFDRIPDAYELYSAIDRKDINFIMRVRDHAFPLLLQKNAGEFPIVYVARIGKSHRDVAILLCGALSRYVNHLDEEDFGKKETITVLRQLRTNLKLAIDYALEPSGDTSLLSSYFQVLIMSEGDVWLFKAIHEVSLVVRRHEVRPTSQPAVHEGDARPQPNGRRESAEIRLGPVATAAKMVRDFCTKELRALEGGGADRRGDVGVEEYIANATMDLVILACWSLVVERTQAEPLPTYTFARDQRTFGLFEEAYAAQEQSIKNKVPRNIRQQLEVVREVCSEVKMSIKARCKVLAERVDGSPT